MLLRTIRFIIKRMIMELLMVVEEEKGTKRENFMSF